jgi:hypothetical protein
VFGRVIGEGIFATDGPVWHSQRKIFANIFKLANFKTFMLQVGSTPPSPSLAL